MGKSKKRLDQKNLEKVLGMQWVRGGWVVVVYELLGIKEHSPAFMNMTNHTREQANNGCEDLKRRRDHVNSIWWWNNKVHSAINEHVGNIIKVGWIHEYDDVIKWCQIFLKKCNKMIVRPSVLYDRLLGNYKRVYM